MDQYGMRRLKYIINEEHINDVKSWDHQWQKQYVYLCINSWLLLKSSWLTDMLQYSPDTVKQFDMKQLLRSILRSYLKIFFSELHLSLRSWRSLNQLILSNHGIWVFAYCEPACVHISTIWMMRSLNSRTGSWTLDQLLLPQDSDPTYLTLRPTRTHAIYNMATGCENDDYV